MSLVQMLEKIGSDAEANSSFQLSENTSIQNEIDPNRKLWCFLVPEKDNDDDQGEDNNNQVSDTIELH